jgi:periplasmic protein TonB
VRCLWKNPRHRMMPLADTHRADDDPLRPVERIVDIVFAGEPAGRGRRSAIALGSVLAVVVTIGALTARMGPSAGQWSAEMAARIHDAIATERSVELTPPAPPPVVLPAPPTASPANAPQLRLKGPSALRGRPAPAAPAQAGALAAVSDAPVDFTGTAFVVGSSAAYAGGTTMRSGTNRAPVAGAVAPGGTGNGASAASGSLARPVSLDQSAWSCDQWPSEADSLQINEQTVVVRVIVRPDGRAERVDIVSDPGFGFGQAARVCVLANRFEPALDAGGHPIAATSPPMRVRFFR